ncbi:MAG: serine/threonine protein kinase [Kiritimatiellae bacterium]|nr:serine/threonine protein kinase [Kiritimatiellia bacterium]
MNLREFAGYPIIRDLTGGGMAHLYVCRAQDQSRVVVRVLKDQYARDRRFHKSFLHAAEVLAKLHHPNIVRLIRTGRDGPTPYMVIEYVDSRNLRDLILHRDPLLTQNPLPLILQMAAALFYVHSAGYVHLDFKPENLLIQENGHVVLVDFDLALEYRNKPIRLREVPGTPAYVAPEVLTERTVDERADIFSFGVTGYEMLTFHKPFEAVTVEQARALQINPAIPPTSLEQYNPSVPAALRSIVLKCLAKRPSDRYPSLSLVIKDLEAIL